MLTDTSAVKPTCANIKSGIQWLVNNCSAGDTLFFYYSGHGAQIQDANGDEISRKDDVLVPLDYQTGGIILDDYLNTNLASMVPAGVSLWAFTDCCHSGTILDLKYNINCNSTYTKGSVVPTAYNNTDWTDQFSYGMQRASDTKGDVYMFSGCLDQQTSADAFISGQAQGAFTACFLQFIKDKCVDGKFNCTLGDMLKEIDCLLAISKFQQRSQLSIGRLEDINNNFSP